MPKQALQQVQNLRLHHTSSIEWFYNLFGTNHYTTTKLFTMQTNAFAG